MSTIATRAGSASWNYLQKFFFQVFFLYFFIQIVPLDWKFYRDILSIDWSHLQFGDIFNLAHYTPQFIEGPGSFANWTFILGISFLGAIAWSLVPHQGENDYSNLYYWIRVLVRYRLAIALLAYGFIKLYPLQAPYPSISNLNTEYGFFNRWKLFSLSLGIVPGYESFLGVVEIVLGLGLLYRKTASLAAFIVIIFTGNVFVSNVAYEGGEYVYSLYLISLAVFILIWDLQRIINLLILQKPTSPNRFKPDFSKPVFKYGRLVSKSLFVFFFVFLYGSKVRAAYNNPYQYPAAKGLIGKEGIYNVAEFKINQQELPYSATDPNRWQDVVFEKWNTISIRSNRPVLLDSSNTDHIPAKDEERIYELEGSGRRHYYNYAADTVNHVLTLNNRNPNYPGEKLVLNYDEPENGKLILRGLDQNRDSIHVVLDKQNKKYLLEEAAKQGRRRGLIL
jgi:hypothetical protein